MKLIVVDDFDRVVDSYEEIEEVDFDDPNTSENLSAWVGDAVEKGINGDHQQVVWVVLWSGDSSVGFEWRKTRDEALPILRSTVSDWCEDPTAAVFMFEYTTHETDGQAITDEIDDRKDQLERMAWVNRWQYSVGEEYRERMNL